MALPQVEITAMLPPETTGVAGLRALHDRALSQRELMAATLIKVDTIGLQDMVITVISTAPTSRTNIPTPLGTTTMMTTHTTATVVPWEQQLT